MLNRATGIEFRLQRCSKGAVPTKIQQVSVTLTLEKWREVLSNLRTAPDLQIRILRQLEKALGREYPRLMAECCVQEAPSPPLEELDVAAERWTG